MEKITLCTFNVENFFVRAKTFPLPPGIRSKKAPHAEEGWGYLPIFSLKNYNLYKDEARQATALALTQGGKLFPHICCLEEVENMATLKCFNKQYLKGTYPNTMLIEANDPRLINVGVLSKYTIVNVVSHKDEKDLADNKNSLFSRDCLEVTFNVDGKPLTGFLNHLKSKMGKTDLEIKRGNEKRKRQAQRVASLLKTRFPGKEFGKSHFVVLGDFNDSPGSEFVAPLVKDAGLENVINRLPEIERWTHWWASKNRVSQLDYILLSPALSTSSSGTPYIERRGISVKRTTSFFDADGKKGAEVDLSFKRFKDVTDEIDASDHCPVFFELTM